MIEQKTVQHMNDKKHSETGRSFIEIAIVIALIGIASAIAVPTLLTWTQVNQ